MGDVALTGAVLLSTVGGLVYALRRMTRIARRLVFLIRSRRTEPARADA